MASRSRVASSPISKRSFLRDLAVVGVALISALRRGERVATAGTEKLAPLLAPADLDARLGDVRAGKIVVFQIGPQVLWKQAHVPGSRWVGAASDDDGVALANAVKAVSSDVEVVAYCGCCPVAHCPNVGPARRVLASRNKASVLDLPTNFKTDWINKGFAVEKA